LWVPGLERRKLQQLPAFLFARRRVPPILIYHGEGWFAQWERRMSQEYSIAGHFADKDPMITAIYVRLVGSLRQFGDVRESLRKTSIHLDHRTGFAAVYTRRSYINLNFRASRPIHSPRIEKMEQLSASRFLHTVRLQSPEQVDAELLGWLRDAYDLAG
jgi:hypothetical protein